MRPPPRPNPVARIIPAAACAAWAGTPAAASTRATTLGHAIDAPVPAAGIMIAIGAAWLLLRRRALPGPAASPTAAPPSTTADPRPTRHPGPDTMLDPLTGLANRVGAVEFIQRRLSLVPRTDLAVLLIDLDGFKIINDSLGHDAGDDLIVRTAQRLTRAARETSGSDALVARLGGDEFLVVVQGPEARRRAEETAAAAHRTVAEPMTIRDHDVAFTASIGIAHASPDCTRAEHLLRDSDTAMYRAKSDGRGRHAFFDPSMHDAARARLRLEADLRHAIAARDITVLYQPIVELATGRVAAFEALARWTHPTRGPVSPGEFIPVAEETGLIVPLGALVLEESCAQLARWADRSAGHTPPGVNVNVPRRLLLDPGFVESVEAVLRRYPGAPDRLRVEVTESSLMAAPEATLAALNRIAAMGVQLQMDDFGTGLSSLASLKKFPFDVLKIDREFVRDLCHGREYMAIMNAIVGLAHNLGMSVTAEGVETAEQLALTEALSCDFAQGYLFAPAVPADEAAELVDRPFRFQPPMDAAA